VTTGYKNGARGGHVDVVNASQTDFIISTIDNPDHCTFGKDSITEDDRI